MKINNKGKKRRRNVCGMKRQTHTEHLGEKKRERKMISEREIAVAGKVIKREKIKVIRDAEQAPRLRKRSK